MTDFSLVCLVSTYREGPPLRAGLRTILEAGFDAVHVWEGPALDVERDLGGAPESPLGEFRRDADVFHGSWPTDAVKHTEMIQHARREFYDRPLWIMWMGGDELLLYGSALRDIAQHLLWQDEAEGRSIQAMIKDPGNDAVAITGGGVVYLLEADGGLSIMRGRLVRGDAIRRYVVGDLVCELITGAQARLGNLPVDANVWMEERFTGMEAGRLFIPPPLPGEPLVVHRSHLRHPSRRTLRMHEQEHAELERLGFPIGKNGR